MMELAVKNTDKKLIVTEEQYEEIKDYKLKLIAKGYGRKYVIAYKDNFSKSVLRILYNGYGVGKKVVYLDGNKFNIQPNNIKLENVLIGEGKKRQPINEEENTIEVGGKTYRFDKKDFEIIKKYTLGYDKRRDRIILNTSKTKNRKAECRSVKAVLFPTKERASISFKNGDSTDYRRSNIEIVPFGTWRVTLTRKEDKFIGVEPVGEMFRVVVTKGQKIEYSEVIECSKIEAAAVYNHIRRQVGNVKILNDTGYTPEEEDEIAVRLIKENVREPVYKRSAGSSKYLGVSFYKGINRWVCRAKLLGKTYYMGVHKTEIEAAKAYNKKALEILGDKAKLNKIEE